MLLIVKYLYENTYEDFQKYTNLLEENKNRVIFLYPNLSHELQVNNIIHDLNEDKDILVIRSIDINMIKQNKIIDDILLGNGFKYENDKTWYPKEIWVYNLRT